MTDVAVQAPARERTNLIWLTVAASSAALLVAALDNLVVTTALPALGRHFNASTQSLEWSVSAYALGFAVSLLAGTALADRFGHRRVFLVGLALFTAASAACAAATNVESFDAARAVQGIGGGLVAALALTIFGDAFAGERDRLAHGLWWGVGCVGILLGPVVGGVLVAEARWQWIFWINVAIGTVAIVLAAAGLQATRGPGRRVDVPGLALASAGFAAIVWGLTRGTELGWTSKQVLPALGAGALWLAAFVVWELAASEPVLSLRAVRERRFLALDVVAFLGAFSVFGGLFLFVQFFEVVQGRTPLRTGLATLPVVGAVVLLAPLAGALCARLGARTFVATGLALQAGAFAWLAHVSAVDVAYARALPGFVAFGAGIGLLLPAGSAALLASVRPEAAGQAARSNAALGAAGGAAGVAGLMAVLLESGSYGSGAAFTHGLVRALWVAAGVAAGAAVVSLMIPGRRRTREVVATVVDPAEVPVAPVEADGEEPPVTGEQLPDVQVGDEEEPDAFPCPVCLGHGWFAFHPPVDPRTEMCARCFGHGQVLTGSHVPAHIVRACPDCEGRGYVEVDARPQFEPPQVRRVERAERPVQIEPAPQPATAGTSDAAEQSHSAISGWDELREKLRPTGSDERLRPASSEWDDFGGPPRASA